MTVSALKKDESFIGSAPVVLVIMDGLGIGSGGENDGFKQAYTPNLDRLMQGELVTKIRAHGTDVGLPTDSDMGNSEVGHNTLGAGRVFSQGAKLVNEAIASGDVFKGKSWREVIKRSSKGTVHLLGLVSDGNVHSHIAQLFQLIEQCKENGIQRLRVHALLDGRDVEQKSALKYIVPLEEKLATLSEDGRDYKIASGGGRMITTMDRYNADWSIVERGWKAHVLGEADDFFSSASSAVKSFYESDSKMTDQYMPSFVIVDDGSPVGKIVDGDSVICFNFRGDRAIEISKAFEDEDFPYFDRKIRPDVFYAGIMQYDGDAHVPTNFLVEPPVITNTLSEYLCASGVKSYAISETQKFGHVTYFWNGNRSGYINENLEKYEEIESDKIQFDLRPWMKAEEITEKVLAELVSGESRFIRLNFANPDMVGHTGVPAAIRIAIETVDLCLGRILDAVLKAGGTIVLTADHGNADIMWTEKNGEKLPMVAHTLNPVPVIIKDYGDENTFSLAGLEDAGLANIAATICCLLGLEPPDDYHESLVYLQ
ncbi:MAG: 2,3-bisphosphoglycerate-independent phosphoglycerate mutase [Desulfotalea sp.]